MDEQAFLRTILANPDDDAPRLVYADWLTEQGDTLSLQKVQYLRMISDDDWEPKSRQEMLDRRKELRRVASELPPSWISIVGKMHLENCRHAGRSLSLPLADGGHVIFSLVCERKWEDLAATEGNTSIRFCDHCQQDVHFCDSTRTALSMAERGFCVAVNPAENRRTGDLAMRTRRLMGKLSPPWPQRG